MGLGRRFRKGDAKPSIRPLPSLEELHRLFSYDPETGDLTWRVHRGTRAAGSLAGTISVAHNYLVVGIDRSYYLAHRLIWKMVTGCDPVAFVDHRDGNKLNNRWQNLRTATNGQNIQNSKLRRDSRSGVKGVCWEEYHQKWVAQIAAGKGQVRIGRFSSIEEATTARRTAEKELHGEFARHEEYVS